MRAISLFAAAAIIVVALFAGCSRSRTVKTSEGDVTVTEKGGGRMEVNTPEGKATYDTEKKTITEAELGVPVYPGATVEMTNTYEGKTGEAGMEGMEHVVLTTPDDVDKVMAFYKPRLKNAETSTIDTGGSKMGVLVTKGTAGDAITVHVMSDKENNVTRIQVMKTKEAK